MQNLPGSKKLSELILLELNGTATDEQRVELKGILTHQEGAIDYYVEFMMLYSGLSQPGEVTLQEEGTEQERVDFDLLFQALAENEKSAIAVEVEKPGDTKNDCLINTGIVKNKRSISKLSIVAAVISSAAMLFITLIALLVPEPVASLKKSVGAVWGDNTGTLEAGSKLRVGDMTLKEGFAEIVFNKGASVIIHSPAIFEIKGNNKVFLWSGRVSSVVPPEATGFTIQTINASIVDYGTEFGVEVKEDGSIGAHVFDGKVKVSGVSRKNKPTKSAFLTNDEAMLVDRAGELSGKYKAQNRDFVRNLETIGRWNSYLNKNLIANPGFEKDTAGLLDIDKPINQQIPDVSITDWVDDTVATIYAYTDSSDQFPRPGYEPVPVNRGTNFFVGVNDCEIYQDIDISALGYMVDKSSLSLSLSGWIGGFRAHKDSIVVTASFCDLAGKENITVNYRSCYASGT